MKKAKIVLAVLLACTLLFTFTACGSSGGSSDSDNTLRVAMIDPNVPIDTNKGTQAYLIMLSDQMCETIIGLDNDTTLYPKLIKEMPTVSEDGLTYSFELKDGVKFHNGETLKASDVKYSYERLITEGIMGALLDQVVGFDELNEGQADELTGFKVQDDTHFTITLKQPYAPFESALSAPYAVVFPEAACKEAGDEWGRTVLYGTGPFTMESYTAGQGIEMKRFEDYHGDKPSIDAISVKFMQDVNTQIMEFQQGNVDFVSIDPNFYETVKQNAEISDNLHSFTPMGLVYFSPNNEDPILSNQKVREALAYAVDREAICNDLLKGAATPAKSFIPKGLLGYDDSLPEYEYNPEKAKALLAEAGYPDGVTLKVLSSVQYPSLSAVAVAIQDQAKPAGINIEIETVDHAAYTDQNKAGKLQLSVSNWYTDYVDPDGMIYQRMSETSTSQVSNKYAGKEFNELITKARQISDENERQTLYAEADKILTHEDFGAIPLYNDTYFYLLSDRVQNFEVTSIYRFYLYTSQIQ